MANIKTKTNRSGDTQTRTRKPRKQQTHKAAKAKSAKAKAKRVVSKAKAITTLAKAKTNAGQLAVWRTLTIQGKLYLANLGKETQLGRLLFGVTAGNLSDAEKRTAKETATGCRSISADVYIASAKSHAAKIRSGAVEFSFDVGVGGSIVRENGLVTDRRTNVKQRGLDIADINRLALQKPDKQLAL